MKKLFAVLAIFALALAGCSNGDSTDNGSNNNGNNNGATNTTLTINNMSSYNLLSVEYSSVDFGTINSGKDNTKTVNTGTRYVFFSLLIAGENVRARTNQAKTCDGGISNELTITNNTSITTTLDEKTNTLKGIFDILSSGTSLKIKNNSSTEITDVRWESVTFSENPSGNSIKIGSSVTNSVESGSGYIFFKRKTNSITARTKDIITVSENNQTEFTFTNDTEIVEVAYPYNIGTLGTLQSVIVWFDNAEGEMQPYSESKSYVSYYASSSDLYGGGTYGTNSTYCEPPKNGNKSIGIGGTTTALLHLKLNLDRKAKISFWYANKDSGNSIFPYRASFKINGDTYRSWSNDINWSYIEFDLEPGINNLVWEKKDGYYNSSSYYFYYYLSLDDILIYYTE